jgi:xanthine dehydrogenase accessory factor
MGSIRQAYRWLVGRSLSSLILGQDGSIKAVRNDPRATGWDGTRFIARNEPDLRIVIAGHGTEVLALTRLALAYGAEVTVLSPDDVIAQSASLAGARATIIAMPHAIPALRLDAFTAVVLLFHDHDWESTLLETALPSTAFYVGALGSRRTQQQRIAILRERDIPPHDIDRLTGPIGLIPASRDPDTLALSVLSQIVARQEAAGALDLVDLQTEILAP